MNDDTSSAIKSFFLGPQAENGAWLSDLVTRVLDHWLEWRRSRFPEDGVAITGQDQASPAFTASRQRIEALLLELLEKMEAETPTVSPRYVGHMVSEVSLPALLGHLTALLQNPNNASHEVARVGLALEEEAVKALAAMLGFNPSLARGHFTSGGTVANYEALWRARYRFDHCISYAAALRARGLLDASLVAAAHADWPSLAARAEAAGVSEAEAAGYSTVLNNPWRIGRRLSELFGAEYRGPVVLVPHSKHYSWPKAVSLLGLGNDALWPVDLDASGHLSLASLRARLEQAWRDERPVLMVVSIAGTTELGAIDPVDGVQDLLDAYRRERGLSCWHHVDAAYGGYFRSLPGCGEGLLAAAQSRALAALPRVDSVTLDPHKLGYVPYACGALLVPDVERYRVSTFDAPYLAGSEHTSKWAWTLEGSRPATGAAATWLTAKALGLDGDGLGAVLAQAIRSMRRFARHLGERIPTLRIAPGCDANVLCFCLAENGESLSATNARTDALYSALREGHAFGVSRTTLSMRGYRALIESFSAEWQATCDAEGLVLIRMVFMNPFVTAPEMSCDYPEEFARELERIVRD